MALRNLGEFLGADRSGPGEDLGSQGMWPLRAAAGDLEGSLKVRLPPNRVPDYRQT